MKKTIIFMTSLLALLVISLIIDARSTAMFLINSSVNISSSISTENDISYGEEPWQKLNLHFPENSQQNAPILLFVHGGGWHSGNKDQYYFVAESFARLGYLVVVPDYIKYPEGRFPTFVEDIAQSVLWVKNNIHKYQGNAELLFISGHSAGAHSAALIIADEHYLNDVGLNRDIIKGFAGVSGPYNFTPKWPQYIETFGRENFTAMKANTHVDGNESPTLLIHSKGDEAVDPFNFESLIEKFEHQGSDAQHILYGESINHINIVLKMHPWFADEVNVANDIDTFFRSLMP